MMCRTVGKGRNENRERQEDAKLPVKQFADELGNVPEEIHHGGGSNDRNKVKQ